MVTAIHALLRTANASTWPLANRISAGLPALEPTRVPPSSVTARAEAPGLQPPRPTNDGGLFPGRARS